MYGIQFLLNVIEKNIVVFLIEIFNLKSEMIGCKVWQMQNDAFPNDYVITYVMVLIISRHFCSSYNDIQTFCSCCQKLISIDTSNHNWKYRQTLLYGSGMTWFRLIVNQSSMLWLRWTANQVFIRMLNRNVCFENVFYAKKQTFGLTDR